MTDAGTHHPTPVAVTGIGVVSAIGIGRATFWRRLIAGESGIGAVSPATVMLDSEAPGVRLPTLAAMVDDAPLRQLITSPLARRMDKFSRRLVGATRPYSVDTDWLYRSPSDMVEQHVDLGASPRATICWGRLVKVWTILVRQRAEVYPEDVQDLATYVLSNRIWLGPHAASHGITSEQVIEDVVSKVPIP